MSSGKRQLVEIKTNGSRMIFQSEFQIFQFSLPAAPNTDLGPLISRAVLLGAAVNCSQIGSNPVSASFTRI